MKTAIASLLLAASSTLAAPHAARAEEDYTVISDLEVVSRSTSRTTSWDFAVTDFIGRDIISTRCHLGFAPMIPSPVGECDNENYLVRVVGDTFTSDFTVEVERVEPAWKGRAHFNEGEDHGDLACIDQGGQTTCIVRAVSVTLDPVIELDDPPTNATTAKSTLSSRANTEKDKVPNPNLSLLDLVARASSASRSSRLEFKLFDAADYPEQTEHFCNLQWAAAGGPREDACDSDAYRVRFVEGSPNISNFTLEVERVKEPNLGDKGRVHFETGTPERGYECIDQPALTTCVINFGKYLEPVE